jgi:AraC-like DNA-binding protein
VGVGLHDHDEGELSWVSEGIQRAITKTGTWVVPPAFAVWLPSGEPHDGCKVGKGSFHWIKLAPERATRLPATPCVVRVTPELRAAIVRAADTPSLDATDAAALADSFEREIRAVDLTPVALPLEEPTLLQPIIARLKRSPADDRSIEEWARFLRISESTLSRAFQRELGLSFRDFRHSVRLLAAVERLADGLAVSDVARELGYRSVSMFVELFRKKLGVTPGRYFAAARAA